MKNYVTDNSQVIEKKKQQKTKPKNTMKNIYQGMLRLIHIW